MASSELHFVELRDVARSLAAKELSPVEVTRAMLARIEALEPKLGSYALVTPELAIEQARAAEREILAGTIKSPLHGVPIAVKDLCWTKGIPTAAGMPIHKEFRPAKDATVVRRLRDAGAVLLGKLQLTEGAFADHHPSISPPVNPWGAAFWPGASSSGSGVATAAGLCYGSLGSDTGGSIRFPSAANGVTGLKPTWGRVSRHGVFPLAETLDHIGPMCRSAADTGAMLAVLAGADPHDPTAVQDPVPDYLDGLERGLQGVRIGVDEALSGTGADPAVRAAVDAAMKVVRDLGAELRPIRFPEVTQIVQDWIQLCAVETAVAHEATYPARKEAYGPGLAGLIEIGRKVSGLDYQKIAVRRLEFRGRVAALFTEIELLLVPAQLFAAPTLAKMATLGEDPDALAALLKLTCPFDMTGSPAITLPAGFTAEGGPVAIQFIGRHLDEALLVQAGHAWQRATDWHRRHPQL